MMKASPMFLLKVDILALTPYSFLRTYLCRESFLKQRDLGQIVPLGRQLYGRERAKTFLSTYKRAVGGKTYGYLLADVFITTPEVLSLRLNIANNGPCEVVYSRRE